LVAAVPNLGSPESDLRHQALDATKGHAQGDGTRPTPAEQQQIVDFEMSLFTAQTTGNGAGNLGARGANGGPNALTTQPFFIGINSQIPAFENPDSNPFNPAIFKPSSIPSMPGPRWRITILVRQSHAGRRYSIPKPLTSLVLPA